MSNELAPILLIDSGLGGLTVARAIHAALPGERLVYFGDTARLPYGSKTPETVAGFVRQIISYLRFQRPKHVVIACNTATAVALPLLRQEFSDLTISGVIDPGARAAITAAGSKEKPVIGVIGTEATIRSDAYNRAIIQRRAHAKIILRPTPVLVPMIEEGRSESDPVLKLAVEQYLLPLVERKMDVLVLGCTHYPIIRGLVQSVVGPGVAVIDSAEQCSQDVARRLGQAGQLATQNLNASPDSANGLATWITTYVTDNSPKFAQLAGRFLGEVIPTPTLVHPDDLYNIPAPAMLVRRAS